MVGNSVFYHWYTIYLCKNTNLLNSFYNCTILIDLFFKAKGDFSGLVTDVYVLKLLQKELVSRFRHVQASLFKDSPVNL